MSIKETVESNYSNNIIDINHPFIKELSNHQCYVGNVDDGSTSNSLMPLVLYNDLWLTNLKYMVEAQKIQKLDNGNVVLYFYISRLIDILDSAYLLNCPNDRIVNIKLVNSINSDNLPIFESDQLIILHETQNSNNLKFGKTNQSLFNLVNNPYWFHYVRVEITSQLNIDNRFDPNQYIKYDSMKLEINGFNANSNCRNLLIGNKYIKYQTYADIQQALKTQS